tara:strand:+ start:211 stop:390 length:180 start_codon:yes stop_codon:yes gene_type:complete
MTRRAMHWVNTPVLMEAILRYEQGRLPKSMRLWIEQLLEINAKDNPKLLSQKITSNQII